LEAARELLQTVPPFGLTAAANTKAG